MIRTIFYLWAFFSVTSFYADAQDLKFRHLTVDNGLSHNTVTCFLQDSKGYMWIGTQDGLNRYDAYNFEIYKREIKNTHSLRSNYISAIAEDFQQTMWVGTVGGGLHQYDAQYNRFKRVQEIGQITVRFLFQDKNNTLWAGAGNALYYFDNPTKKFVKHPIFTQWELTTILEYAPQELLIGTNGGGIFYLNLQSKEVQNHLNQPNNPASLCHNSVTSLYRDSQHNIWVGTEKGLDRFLPIRAVFEHFPVEQDKTKSLQAASVKFIAGKEKEVWVATENGGLSILNIETMRFRHYVPEAHNPECINDLSIWTIYVDKQNRFWVGTFSGGANILDGHWKKFAKPDIKLQNQTVNALWKDSQNRLWIGTEGGLTVKDGEQTTRYNHHPTQPTSLGNNPVLAIYEDNKNRIWVGTWAGGLSLFDEAQKQFKNFKENPKDTKKLPDPNIFSITQSKQTGQILVGSFGGMSALVSEDAQAFANYNHSKQKALSSDLVRAVFEDSKQNIWVGTIDGLNKFDAKSQTFTHYLHSNEDANSISNNYINCFLEDSKGQFWIGTSDGLNLMQSDKKFLAYTTANGLPNNAINGILEDKKGNLWISTNKGIAHFNPVTKQCRNYDESDGLQSNQFKPASAFKSSEGELFFGGTNGFNAFYPENIKDNPHIPNVVITDLKLFNKSVHINGADSVLRQDIRQTKAITLTHRQSVFTLNFVALNFTLSEKNQYAYKLEPFETEWNYVGSKREATYTNLDAGTYTFRVKASNNDGLWNEEGITLKITILPPWWETWWFRLFVFVVVAGSGISFYKVRTDGLKKQKRVLEQKVIERTNEIEQKGKELQIAYQEIQVTNEELNASIEQLGFALDRLDEQKGLVEAVNQKITASINYALTIQKAILPNKSLLERCLKEYWLIYRPKDVVSGDFYWVSPLPTGYILAVADCTGHGVAGSFMSLIGISLLNKLERNVEILTPAEIIVKLNMGVENILKQDERENYDNGMDIGIIKVEKTQQDYYITFAGAKRPLYFRRKTEGTLQEIGGDRCSVGMGIKKEMSIQNHTLVLHEGDMLYLSSDGFTDQNNDRRKKFGANTLKETLENTFQDDLPTQLQRLETKFDEHRGEAEQRDDVTLLGVRLG